MSEHVFYAKPNKGNQRKVTVMTPQLLIGKAPTKQKRIKMKLNMGLSTQKATGTPEWIAAAHEFVAKNHDTVSPKVDLRGMTIAFAPNSLFNGDTLAAEKCQMRGFSIEEQGDSESPEVVMMFLAYAPFSTGLWEYLGQMAGDEIWAKFEQATEPDEEDGEEEDEDEDEDEDDEEEAAGDTVQ